VPGIPFLSGRERSQERETEKSGNRVIDSNFRMSQMVRESNCRKSRE